jgi:long-chain fatty acid transport protein
VWHVSDRVRVGFGLTSPFGLATAYDKDWVGKYNTYYTSLQTFDFNPALGMRVTDWLSVGAGASIQYAKADRRNMLDFGSICFNSGLGSGACTALGLTPQAADGRLELTADDWSVGYNVGILLHPTSRFRVGLAYRSRIHQRLDGTADFTVPEAAEPLTASGAFQDSDASAEITLPERASLSLYYEATPQLTLLGDVTWTAWSHFDELRVDFDNPAQPPIAEPEDWDDSFRYSIGARYQVTDEWVARAGFAFDETPIDSDMRNPGIPGNDRLVFAVGAGYRLSDAVNIDFAYTYNRELEAQIDQSRSDSGTVEGNYNNSTHLLTAQAVWRF